MNIMNNIYYIMNIINTIYYIMNIINNVSYSLRRSSALSVEGLRLRYFLFDEHSVAQHRDDVLGRFRTRPLFPPSFTQHDAVAGLEEGFRSGLRLRFGRTGRRRFGRKSSSLLFSRGFGGAAFVHFAKPYPVEVGEAGALQGGRFAPGVRGRRRRLDARRAVRRQQADGTARVLIEGVEGVRDVVVGGNARGFDDLAVGFR